MNKLILLFCTLALHIQAATYEVLSLGAAITDYLIPINEEEFAKLSMEKGSWAPCELEQFTEWVQLGDNITLQAGGSAVNVIKGLSSLGHNCAILGKVGKDDIGDLYTEKLLNQNVTPILYKEALNTGRALCFITPDGERTMRTCLGGSHKEGDPGLSPKIFEGVRLFHIEGYQIQDLATFKKALFLAKEAKAIISMDMGNYLLVKEHKNEFLELIKEYVNILFANEKEAEVLTSGMVPMDASIELSKLADIVVVTMSEKGGWVKSKEDHYFFPAITTNAVDTTGAGDLFSAGFLHAYLSGAPIDKSAHFGALIASQVVKVIGAEIPKEEWQSLQGSPSLQ